MQPSLIRSTAESSLELLAHRRRGTPEAFLLSWVAWEGLKIRLLVVGLSMQGWQVQQVYETMSGARVHALEQYRQVFRRTFGVLPENARGVGHHWQQIEGFRNLRNRYVHGMAGAAPMRLEAATHLINDRVLQPDWLGQLRVPTPEGPCSLGSPYRRLHSGVKMRRSLKDLRLVFSTKAGSHR